MNALDRYRNFCVNAPDDFPLFMHDWYLDAVCGDSAWSAATVESGGKTVAVMPYFLKKKWIWTFVTMPLLSKFHGPYLLPEYRTHDNETHFYAALLDQIPLKPASFFQDFNYTVTNWLPFYWRGFRQTTRYSYYLDLQQPETAIFQQIHKKYQAKIRKAETLVRVVDRLPAEADIQLLHRMCSLSFERQDAQLPLDFPFFERVVKALVAHDRCRCWIAEDVHAGEVHSAALLVYDRQSAYYLFSGDDARLRSSGSAVLLKWAAIRYAKNILQCPIFDFEGSMMPNIETGRRAFGARQRPYFRLQKEWSWWWRIRAFMQNP